MKSKKEFKEIISDSFWKHIQKNSFIPIKSPIEREQFCDELYDQISKREYHPSLPREYVVSDKHNGATRLIPVFNLKDTAVFYYCVKSLEDYLAEGYVDCTFGGFRLSGRLTEREDDLFNEINAVPVYGSAFSFNPTAWANAWRGFQHRAFQVSREEELKRFVFLDISNFYPSINLTLLENKIRNCADKTLCDEIDLLFYFLKYWDRKSSFYAPRGVGLPMDDFGESARLLANFFLQEYDKKVSEYCRENGSRYLRYADDQIVCAPDEETANKIVRFASLELSRIGLSMNAGKIKHFNREEFEVYWAFQIFDQLQNQETFEEGVKGYLNTEKNKVRWVSILKFVINSSSLKEIDLSLKSRIFGELFDPEFLTKCDFRYLLRLYELLETEAEKKKYLETLRSVAEKCLYTEFHYSILLAKEKGLPIDFEEEIREKINTLRFSYE